MPSTPVIEAAWQLREEFLRRRAARERLLADAREAARAGRFDEAACGYRALLERDRNSAAAWHGLGDVHAAERRWQDAFDAFLKSVEIDPSNGLYHYAIGLALEHGHSATDAIARYARTATRTMPPPGDGEAAVEPAALEQIEALFRAHADESNSQWLVCLGNVQMARLAVDRAIESYRAALRLAPDDATVLENLSTAFAAKSDTGQSDLFRASALFRRADYDEAIVVYRRAVASGASDQDGYVALGDCLRQVGRHTEAAATYAEGLVHHPRSGRLYSRSIAALHALGQTEEARRVARQGAKVSAGDLSLRYAACLTVPAIYPAEDAILQWRRRFARGLDVVERETRLDTPRERARALEAIGSHSNFFLAYQCRNDRLLQTRYGRLVARIMAATYPHWSERRRMPSVDRGRIRIGYVSAFMRRHAVASDHLGWLQHANRERFAIHAYHLGQEGDSVTDAFRRGSDVFRSVPDSLEHACSQIIGDNLHVLVFLDIGMFPRATQMAGLRLAPVQCTTWGHPITSGLPTIDYFISSDLMEPQGANQHYSEQLVRLPNIGIAYARPDPPSHPASRAAFGIPDAAVVFFCGQSPYKYLPQYDDVLVEIGRRVPRARFVFVASHPSAGMLEQRITSAFRRAGMETDRMCQFVGPQSWPGYLSLLLVSDVFLDTFEWSGCNTALEALALGVPIVTCPGRFLRGRHAYAFLTQLGVGDTVAGNRRSYVDVAVRLATDHEWRDALLGRITPRLDSLFDDRTAVTALEQFYFRIAGA